MDAPSLQAVEPASGHPPAAVLPSEPTGVPGIALLGSLDKPREPRLKAPRDARELFQLLSGLQAEDELDAFLARVDFAGANAAQLHRIVLGAVRDNQAKAGVATESETRAAFRQALLSREFRQRAMAVFLGAFDELRREIFIHVPKCAGTDLSANLSERLLPYPTGLGDPGFVGKAGFLTTLGDLARSAPEHDRVFVHGHINLGHYLSGCGIRPGDHIFSIIREPVSLMVSQANYAIGRLRQDPEGRDPDSAATLRRLGMTRLPEDISDQELKDLTVRALLDPGISISNQACRHLGPTHSSGFAETIIHIIATNVEITTTETYERWLRERWEIPRSERRNQSATLLTAQEATRLFAHELAQATTEDQKLFDLITWAIQAAGTASITGRQLGRLIGPKPVVPFAEELTRTMQAARENAAKGLFAIEERRAIDCYLARPSVSSLFSPTVTEPVSVTFGVRGNGNGYLGPGWYPPEDGFVWSQGKECALWLPPGPQNGVSVMRLIGNPFVHAGALPAQEISISVNGRAIGSRKLREFAMIEFEIPADITAAAAPLEIVLTIPTAARPSDVSGSRDDRELGFSLARMEFLNYYAPPRGGDGP